MNLDQNHADIAWGNNLMQFNNSEIMKSFFKAIHKPHEDIQKATKALLEERWIDRAVGKQLDGIGQILRQSRYVDFPIPVNYFGFSGQKNIGGFGKYKFKDKKIEYLTNITELQDDEYRRVLYWRIAVLTGSGTAPDINKALGQILDINEIRITAIGNANLKIFMSLKTNTNTALINKIDRWLPIAAGVGYKVSVSIGKKTFGFKSQGLSGFGIGSLAREI